MNLVVFDGGRLRGYNTDWRGYRDGLLAGLPDATLSASSRSAAAARARRQPTRCSHAGTRLDLPTSTRSGPTIWLPAWALFPVAVGHDGPPRDLADAIERANGVVHATPWECSTTLESPSTSIFSSRDVGVGCRVSTAGDRAHPPGGRARPSRARRRPDGRGSGVRQSADHHGTSSRIVTGCNDTSVHSSAPRSGRAQEEVRGERAAGRSSRGRGDRPRGAHSGEHPGGRHCRFAASGYAGARVDEIAARTRTTKRMIYYYFGSKEGLYLAVLERVYAQIRRSSAASRSNVSRPMRPCARSRKRRITITPPTRRSSNS